MKKTSITEQGDWKGAERLRRQAEVMSLRSSGVQMFKSHVTAELNACFKARDLVGIQDASERIHAEVARFPRWLSFSLYADCCFHLARGDYAVAVLKCEACIADTAFDAHGLSPNPMMWLAAQAALTEALFYLQRTEEARDRARAALAEWPYGEGVETVDLMRGLALAEAKLGEADASARLEKCIAQQTELGVTGLRLGLSYEARAQIAIWQRDAESFEHYAACTAREYRYGQGSEIGARYDRLINEAGRHGLRARATLTEFTNDASDAKSLVERSMSGTARVHERARTALELICHLRGASDGHLYLTSPQGLAIAASQGNKVPPHDLATLNALVAGALQRAAALDEMATDELAPESAPHLTIEADGVSYKLLLLSCTVGASERVAGLAAIAARDAPFDLLQQGQLLHALATHLLQLGDSTGIQFSQ